jgi:hypothetical protein
MSRTPGRNPQHCGIGVPRSPPLGDSSAVAAVRSVSKVSQAPEEPFPIPKLPGLGIWDVAVNFRHLHNSSLHSPGEAQSCPYTLPWVIPAGAGGGKGGKDQERDARVPMQVPWAAPHPGRWGGREGGREGRPARVPRAGTAW